MKRHGVRGDPRYRLRSSETRWEGGLVGVSVERFVSPTGRECEQEVIHLPDAVAVVALESLPEGGRNVVLIEQFRNSVRGWIHEVPAGIIEDGEDPETTAARELEEETGFRAGELCHVASLLMIPGTSAHRLHFFLAGALAPGRQSLDEAECLRVRRVPFEPLVRRMVQEPPGSTPVCDAKTHLALLHVARLVEQGNGAP